MDKIIVRTINDTKRLVDWAAAQEEDLRWALPFTEGELIFSEELIMLRFRELQGDWVSLEMWIHAEPDDPWKKVVSWELHPTLRLVENVHIEGTPDQRAVIGMHLAKENVVGKCNNKFVNVMLFATHYHEELKRTRSVTRTGGSKTGKRRDRRPLVTRRYVIAEDLLDEVVPVKREWKGYQESFGVRGHYRKYRSGKVVWIRPYQKKGRNQERMDKEYVV